MIDGSINEIIEFLRNNRIYLDIESRLPGYKVTRIYRIYEQEETHHGHTLEEAVKSAAKKAFDDMKASDEYWDALAELMSIPGIQDAMKEYFGEGLKKEFLKKDYFLKSKAGKDGGREILIPFPNRKKI